MVKKKAKSQVPNDPFTWATGNNFGLDAFDYERENNQGVLNTKLERTPKLSLPDGFLPQAQEAYDVELGSIIPINLSKEAAVVDLEWLDPDQEQDPTRLPRGKTQGQPPLDTVSVLEDLWGSVRTTGIDLVPNKKKEKPKEDYKRSMLPGEEIAVMSKRALRRAHFGYSLPEIKKEAEFMLKEKVSLLKPVFDFIAKEGSLIGNVYVIADAFPGLKNGRWVDSIRKHCREAKYILTKDVSLESKVNKVAVLEVPWKEAFSYYSPRLEALGKDVKVSKNHKLNLKKAFSQVVVSKKPDTLFPVEKIKMAKEMPRLEVISKQALEEKTARDKVLSKIAKWAKEGFISKEEHLKFASSEASGDSLLKSAVNLIQYKKSKVATYQGPRLSIPNRHPIWMDLQESERALKASKVKSFEKYAKSCVSKGIVSKAQVDAIIKMDKDLVSKEKLLQHAIAHFKPEVKAIETRVYANKNSAFTGNHVKKEYTVKDIKSRDVLNKSVQRYLKANVISQAQADQITKSKEDVSSLALKLASMTQSSKQYEGLGLNASVPVLTNNKVSLDPEQKQLLSIAKKAGVSVSEVEGLVHKTKALLHKGLVGNALTAALQGSTDAKVYKAASRHIEALRNEMEGLVGHLYVDPAFYIKGGKCDEGSTIHRADPIPYVKEISACASCIFKKATPDGFSCSKYRKEVVAEFEGEQEYKRKVLASQPIKKQASFDYNKNIAEHEDFFKDNGSFWE